MENKINSEKNNHGKKNGYKINGKLILSYYDSNDPDLDIFNKLNLESLDNNENNKMKDIINKFLVKSFIKLIINSLLR